MSETTQTAPETKTRGVRLTQHGETQWLVIRREVEDPKQGLVTKVDAYILQCRGGLYQLAHGNKVYNVRLGDRPSCTCPDHTYRRRECKHLAALKKLVEAGRLS